MFASAIEEWLTANHEPTRSQLDQVCKNRVEITIAAGMQDMEL
jgi:hypothetical protein